MSDDIPGVAPRAMDSLHKEKGEFLYCAQFCDNDVVVAGGSGTNSVQAINTKTEQVYTMVMGSVLHYFREKSEAQEWTNQLISLATLHLGNHCLFPCFR